MTSTVLPTTIGEHAGPSQPTTRGAFRRGLRFAAARTGVRIGRAASRTVAIVALLAVWETAPRLGVVDPVFLPPLSEVLAAWWALARSGELAEHAEASLVRSLTGFALAVAVAIPLGLLIGWYRPRRRPAQPAAGGVPQHRRRSPCCRSSC